MFDLETLKAYLLEKIDQKAQTLMPTVKSFHTAKLEEARDILDLAEERSGVEELFSLSADQIIDRYPLLSGSLEVDGPNLIEVAKKVHAAAMKARMVTEIEIIRRETKRKVLSSLTKEEAEGAYRSAAWPAKADAK